MIFNLSKKAISIKPSATLEISAKAKALKASGVDIIDFGIGEPDFNTPDNIKEKAKEAIDLNMSKYTPASGINELKKAICTKLLRDNNLEYNPENIIVTSGAKHALFSVLFTLLDKDDEVVVLSPYWVSYPQLVEIVGGIPKFINEVSTDNLNNILSAKTKAIIINSPNNPSGDILSKEELEIISEWAIKNNVFVISDEIYENLIYDDNKHYSIASFNDDIKALTILVNGMSKSYSMTGYRLGYVAAHKDIIKVMSNFQSQTVSHPSSISQYASIIGLTSDQSSVEIMRKEFEERRNLIVDLINDVNGLSIEKPKGAFYAFVNIEDVLNKSINNKLIKNSIDFSNLLLDEIGVVSVPGIEFGDDNYIRLSYATSKENITLGIARVKKLLG